MTQMTLDQYVPAKERNGTSEAAAKDPLGMRLMLRERVVDTLYFVGPLTADEIAGRMSESILSIRPRLSELLRLGLVRKTAMTRKNASGKSARVWELV